MTSARSAQTAACDCCPSAPPTAVDSPAPPGVQRTSLRRRGLEFAGWLIPGALLAIFPKCPLCVAGYVALFTGLGISLTVAAYLRWSLFALCLAALALMAARLVARRLRSRFA
jgi:hypothetical protein